MKHIENTLNNLEEAFGEFKKHHSARLDSLEARNYRPRLESGAGNLSLEEAHYKQAFLNYLQKGEERELQGLEKKSLSAGSDKDGGFLVPKMISLKMEEELKNLSLMRSLASVMTISTDAVDLLVDKKGAAVGWVGEADERRETETPEFSQIKIPVHEIYACSHVTPRLLEDASINVEEWLIARIGESIAKTENKAFFTGDGKNKPKGFLTYDSCLEKNWEWGKLEHLEVGKIGFSKDSGVDILIDCVSALKPQYHSGAVWVMSRSANALVRKLKDHTGNYLWHPNNSYDQRPMLLGFPVIVSNEMPEIDLEGDRGIPSIAFGNFKQGYQIVDRANMTVLRDPYSAKPYVEFYTTARVGGSVIDFEAIKMIFFHQDK